MQDSGLDTTITNMRFQQRTLASSIVITGQSRTHDLCSTLNCRALSHGLCTVVIIPLHFYLLYYMDTGSSWQQAYIVLVDKELIRMYPTLMITLNYKTTKRLIFQYLLNKPLDQIDLYSRQIYPVVLFRTIS